MRFRGVTVMKSKVAVVLPDASLDVMTLLVYAGSSAEDCYGDLQVWCVRLLRRLLGRRVVPEPWKVRILISW